MLEDAGWQACKSQETAATEYSAWFQGSYRDPPWPLKYYDFASIIHFMHKAYIDFSNYSWPRFFHGGVCKICYCGGWWNQNRFWPNSRAERTRRGVQGPIQGFLVGFKGNHPDGRAPGSSMVFRVFKTPKRLSSHCNFLSFFGQFLLQN